MSNPVRESNLEDYIIEKLKGNGWRFVEASKLGREDLKEPLLERHLFEKMLEINRKRLPEITENDIIRAISLIKGTTSGVNGARRILEYLKWGVPIKLEKTKTTEKILLIDYENPEANSFIVSRQIVHRGAEEIRNDILLYVNGIPIVNIECKNPTDIGVSWEDAFVQIKRYEREVPELYKYVQIGVAAESAVKYFPIVPWLKRDKIPVYTWKVPEKKELNQFEALAEMLAPETLLDILQNFLYFRAEEGKETKVIARYMQYYSANKIVERVMKRMRGESDIDRGLIWHWQGSGKTLTMIFAGVKLYKLLKDADPIIMFLVDRVELQEQLYFENLTKLDLGPNISAKLIGNMDRLKDMISYRDYQGESGIFVVLIYKFRPNEFENFIKYLKGVSKTRADTVMDKKEVVIFIDEAHRTQYGVLSETMEEIFKNANYFAFTGTPAPRSDPRKNTFQKFSPEGEAYLDKYFILDSIEDGFTVKIAYQPGRLDYYLEKELLKEFLDSELDTLPESVRERVKEKLEKEVDVRRIKLFLENENRIEEVTKEIVEHFKENVDGKFKAMVVAVSRKACVLYKKAFDKYLPPEYTEVIMTFQNEEKEEILEEYKKEIEEKYKSNDPEVIMKEIVEKFKEEEVPKILIVTDKLLTGFDAPILQTMYLDKPMKGHTLLQAIARVNRPYKGVKEFGLVVDYVGIFTELEKAFRMYEKEDLKGAVYDVNKLYREFRSLLNENIKIAGAQPTQGNPFPKILEVSEKLARNKQLERKFLSNFRRMRRIYEQIASMVTPAERMAYSWISSVYSYYIKNVQGEDSAEDLAKRYFKKTLNALNKALKVSEKEGDFTKIMVDKEFFKKFIKRKDIDDASKARALLMSLSGFTKTEKSTAVYESLADKIGSILEAWRKKLKRSEELYEEAKKLWEEIYQKRYEKQRLGFSDLEYIVFEVFKKSGMNEQRALELTKQLMKEIHDYIIILNWVNLPAVVNEVEKKVALFILLNARKEGIPPEKAKELANIIIHKVKHYGSKGLAAA